jgi:hypothetical protein
MKIPGMLNNRIIIGRILKGLVLTIIISSMYLAPALAFDGYDRWGGHGREYYEHRERGYECDRRHYRNPYVYGRPVYRPYGYSNGYIGRVYTPPPVVYAPPPPLGIGIFFPPVIIHP